MTFFPCILVSALALCGCIAHPVRLSSRYRIQRRHRTHHRARFWMAGGLSADICRRVEPRVGKNGFRSLSCALGTRCFSRNRMGLLVAPISGTSAAPAARTVPAVVAEDMGVVEVPAVQRMPLAWAGSPGIAVAGLPGILPGSMAVVAGPRMPPAERTVAAGPRSMAVAAEPGAAWAVVG